MMLLRHGAVVAEGWWAPYAPIDRTCCTRSARASPRPRSGFAVAEGLVDLDDTVLSHFPELDAEITDPRCAPHPRPPRRRDGQRAPHRHDRPRTRDRPRRPRPRIPADPARRRARLRVRLQPAVHLLDRRDHPEGGRDAAHGVPAAEAVRAARHRRGRVAHRPARPRARLQRVPRHHRRDREARASSTCSAGAGTGSSCWTRRGSTTRPARTSPTPTSRTPTGARATDSSSGWPGTAIAATARTASSASCSPNRTPSSPSPARASTCRPCSTPRGSTCCRRWRRLRGAAIAAAAAAEPELARSACVGRAAPGIRARPSTVRRAHLHAGRAATVCRSITEVTVTPGERTHARLAHRRAVRGWTSTPASASGSSGMRVVASGGATPSGCARVRGDLRRDSAPAPDRVRRRTAGRTHFAAHVDHRAAAPAARSPRCGCRVRSTLRDQPPPGPAPADRAPSARARRHRGRVAAHASPEDGTDPDVPVAATVVIVRDGARRAGSAHDRAPRPRVVRRRLGLSRRQARARRWRSRRRCRRTTSSRPRVGPRRARPGRRRVSWWMPPTSCRCRAGTRRRGSRCASARGSSSRTTRTGELTPAPDEVIDAAWIRPADMLARHARGRGHAVPADVGHAARARRAAGRRGAGRRRAHRRDPPVRDGRAPRRATDRCCSGRATPTTTDASLRGDARGRGIPPPARAGRAALGLHPLRLRRVRRRASRAAVAGGRRPRRSR